MRRSSGTGRLPRGPRPHNIGFNNSSLNCPILKSSIIRRPSWRAFANAAPGIFTADGSGRGAAAALNQDGSSNRGNPAPAGSVVTFFATGEGLTQPAVLDGSGAALATATARDGLPASLTVFLKAGVYLVRVQAFTTDGSPLLPLTFAIQGVWLSDPIGPQEEDPTTNPQPAPTSSSGSTSQTSPSGSSPSGTSSGTTSSSSTGSGTSSQTTTDSYAWTYDESSGVSSEDPSGNPYTAA